MAFFRFSPVLRVLKSRTGLTASLAWVLLLLSCTESRGQSAACATSVNNATVVIPPTTAVKGTGFSSPNPDSIAVFTSDGTCIGKAPWPRSNAKSVALAGSGTLEATGLEDGESFHFRLYGAGGEEYRGGSGTFVKCERFPSGLKPLCRDDGSYKSDAVYRLRSVRLGATSAGDIPSVEELTLSAPYPNPTRGPTAIQFATPKQQDASLKLYDTLGRVVKTLGQGEVKGRQVTQADLSRLSSGVYFLRLRSEGETRTRRITVVQ